MDPDMGSGAIRYKVYPIIHILRNVAGFLEVFYSVKEKRKNHGGIRQTGEQLGRDGKAGQ